LKKYLRNYQILKSLFLRHKNNLYFKFDFTDSLDYIVLGRDCMPHVTCSNSIQNQNGFKTQKHHLGNQFWLEITVILPIFCLLD